MWIKQIEIENFKSFYEPETMRFAAGFNLILGANNAGKSSVLQALDLTQEFSAPHRSVRSLPAHGMRTKADSRAMITARVTLDEFREARVETTWWLPIRDECATEVSEMTMASRTLALLGEREIAISLERGGLERVQIEGERIGMAPALPRIPSAALAVTEFPEGPQVAALYVVLTSRQPQVICIDEPNQFLHPKALRELLQILASEGKQHQYILTAHSAEVISAVRAETVTLLTLDNGMTRVRQTTQGGLATLRDGFADLGIRATELHGRDQVLWVEGQTEELVFPTLLAHFCARYAAGTAVLCVHDTGAFDKRGFDPIRVVEIYRRLTGASALVPPMVAVVLDRERRTADACAKLEADKRAHLRFLPRRMLENYLLHPQGVAAVLSELGCTVDADQIRAAMERAAPVDHSRERDLDQVDGGQVLSAVFAHCSGALWEFKKTRDVPALVEWLIANDPNFLQPLGQWLAGLMDLKDSNAEAATVAEQAKPAGVACVAK